MPNKADHIARAAEVIAVFQRQCKTADEHTIADLICDLGHLAEERGIEHWYAGHNAHDRDHIGPDAAVEISITPR